jgi:Tfp pilus assembly protein PilV
MAGFTLIEALVAVTLSAILVTLVTTVFFAQNQFYSEATLRSHVQENARSVTQFVTSELQSAGTEAFQLAENRQLRVRKPLALGIVCAIAGDDVHAYLLQGSENVVGNDVAGWGVRDTTGAWAYYTDTWSNLNVSSGSSSAFRCENSGADTVGATADFFRLRNVKNSSEPKPEVGWVVMVYQDLHYQFSASALETGTIGLYRGNYGDTLVELSTGMTANAGFRYRLAGDTTFLATVTGTQLDSIEAVRLTATAESTGQLDRTGDNTYSYGWTADILLKNVH